MRKWAIAAISVVLGGCGFIKIYEGPDAATVERSCPISDKAWHNTMLLTLDGRLMGSGTDCSFIYSLPPGKHDLKISAQYPLVQRRAILDKIFEFKGIQIRPYGRYIVSTTFADGVLSVDAADERTGEKLFSDSTKDFRTSSMENAALQALPIIVK